MLMKAWQGGDKDRDGQFLKINSFCSISIKKFIAWGLLKLLTTFQNGSYEIFLSKFQ